METIEQALRRIFKNAPHIYAECVRCAKERPRTSWGEESCVPLFSSHRWEKVNKTDAHYRYWAELNEKLRAFQQIGPDYPLPPDSQIRQKEIGNWYRFVGESDSVFIRGNWYKCIDSYEKSGKLSGYSGFVKCYLFSNNDFFDWSNPLPHDPSTNPTLEENPIINEVNNSQVSESKIEQRLVSEIFQFSKGEYAVKLHVNHEKQILTVINKTEYSDDEEEILELKLEAVRFAKKRLELLGNYPNN